MDHRHISSQGDQYSIAKISSILERGGASEIKKLLAILKSNPSEEIAHRARISCENSDVYGYPALIIACLDAWQDQNKK